MEGTTSKVATILQEIGAGAKSLLPDLAETVVETYDKLVFNSDGTVSTFTIICVVGLVAVFGKWVIGKMRKHVV